MVVIAEELLLFRSLILTKYFQLVFITNFIHASHYHDRCPVFYLYGHVQKTKHNQEAFKSMLESTVSFALTIYIVERHLPLVLLFHIATSDYTLRSGKVTITEEALLQCVPISIRYDSTTETHPEYFTFQISSAVTVSGLSVEPSEAEISIFDRDCELKHINILISTSIHKF